MFWCGYRILWQTVVLTEWKWAFFSHLYTIFIFLPLSLNSVLDAVVFDKFNLFYTCVDSNKNVNYPCPSCLCVSNFLTVLRNFKCPLIFCLHIINKVTWCSQRKTIKSWTKDPKFYPWSVFGSIFLLRLKLSPLLLWQCKAHETPCNSEPMLSHRSPPLAIIWLGYDRYPTSEMDSLPLPTLPEVRKASTSHIYKHTYICIYNKIPPWCQQISSRIPCTDENLRLVAS
jgi:hypothetical protein